MTNFDRLSILPGEIARMEIGFSEVACHLGVAGKTMFVELLCSGNGNPLETQQYAAQLYTDDLEKFSMPITYGEAGIYRDAAGFYHY